MTLIQLAREQGDLLIGGNFVNKLTRLSQFLSPVSPVSIYWLFLAFDSQSLSVSHRNWFVLTLSFLLAHPLDKRLATTGGYFIVTVNWVRMGWEGLCIIMFHSRYPCGYRSGRGGEVRGFGKYFTLRSDFNLSVDADPISQHYKYMKNLCSTMESPRSRGE